jgi:hypothetical protein
MVSVEIGYVDDGMGHDASNWMDLPTRGIRLMNDDRTIETP